uniref:40S ribosomal protein S30 n=1 Tax=Acartia pacifica TaxID=335913 RepID=R9TI28_ACAPC|nr:40S ribosomal protein S30 [Acartia pacifica]ALS04055.1 40S ribosomal protein S30 [Acartia pacifica]
MQLIVRSQNTHVIDVAPEANVEVLRAQLAQLEGVEAAALSLSAAGTMLEDNMSVALLSGLPVDVNIPLLGGKVHGSLARAGKVRGQTPKVEAVEKKKKKTGRAKRRIQYNRRFVTTVETFGKKKGPNSNS